MKEFHNVNEEPECPKVIVLPCDDNRKFEVKKYREEMYKFFQLAGNSVTNPLGGYVKFKV